MLIQLLAMVDRMVDDVSSTATKAYRKRAYEVFGDQRFARLAGILVSHIYNRHVAKLLNSLMVRLPKSRLRYSNDNALAESKNNYVVRKNMQS